MAQCGRCGAESKDLKASGARYVLLGAKKVRRPRERLCQRCRAEARAHLITQCGRCGAESKDLKVLRGGYVLQGAKKVPCPREHVCQFCYAKAKAHRRLTPAEVAGNARWDAIFSRFVDPDYYAARVPTVGSSFGAFASQMEMLCQ